MAEIDILFISPVGELIGGGDRSLMLLAGEVVQKTGYKVGCAFLEDGPMVEQFQRLGVRTFVISTDEIILKVRRTDAIFSPFALIRKIRLLIPVILQLRRIIKQNQVKILHANGLKADVIASLAGLFSKVKVIWHIRDFVREYPVQFLFGIMGALKLNRAICVSHAVAAPLPVRPSKKVVVYNATDFERIDSIRANGLREQIRSQLQILPEEILIANLSRIVPWKGQRLILESFLKLAPDYPGLKLLFVGAGEKFDGDQYYLNLRQQASESPFSDRIIFTGQVDNALDYYPAIDIFLHTTVEPDPLPRCVMEAIAFGLPVIGFNTGGMTEMVTSGTGILVEQKSGVEGIIQAVSHLIKNPELREKMAMSARSQSRTRYTKDLHIKNICGIWGGLICNLK